MQSKFYFSAVGNEDHIRNLHAEMNIPDAEVKELKPNPLDTHSQSERWLWRSPYQICAGDFPEDELIAYLRGNDHVLSVFARYGSKLRDIGPVIVSFYDENEPARGYSISPALIQILAKVNASLEIDIVKTLGEVSTQ